MLKRIAVASLFLLLASPCGMRMCYADNAEVLPKGISRAAVNGKFYLPIDERYDPDGDTEDVATDFNDTLDSSVFPALALVEAAAGLPAGFANIGRTDISFEYDFKIFEFSYQYGITDKLTLGFMVPYWDVTNDVDAKLVTTNATVGKSATLNTLAPLGVEDTVPLTTNDAQNLIGKGLDVNGDGTVDIPGYGYEPIRKWSGSGISDIEVGFRYQYLKTPDWRLAFTGGVRIPTGEKDDPDNLVDYPLGAGAWALLFQFNNDYVGIKNLVLNATLRYDLYLPDTETKRVLDDVNDVLTTNREKVDRDLGDIIELEGSAAYQISEGLNISLLYKYGFSFKDRVSGDLGFAYKSLEDETDFTEHVGIVGLSYSTLPLYKAKKFPVPLNVSVSYRNRFAGSNNAMKSEYIGVGLNIYF